MIHVALSEPRHRWNQDNAIESVTRGRPALFSRCSSRKVWSMKQRARTVVEELVRRLLILMAGLFLLQTQAATNRSSDDALHNWSQWRGPLANGVARSEEHTSELQSRFG